MTGPEEGQTQEDAGFAPTGEWRSLDVVFDQVEKQLDIQWQLWESWTAGCAYFWGLSG